MTTKMTTTAKRNAFSDAIIRHELGHILTTNADVVNMRKWLKQKSQRWWTTTISKYSQVNSYEAIAEVFSAVTSKEYVVGTLPRKMEIMVSDMITR